MTGMCRTIQLSQCRNSKGDGSFVKDMLATGSLFRFENEARRGCVCTPETRWEEVERQRVSTMGIWGRLRSFWFVLLAVQ